MSLKTIDPTLVTNGEFLKKAGPSAEAYIKSGQNGENDPEQTLGAGFRQEESALRGTRPAERRSPY